MKKFVIGLIVGIAITASATAFADEIESIIGKTVEGQFPVKIDGVTLDKQAAVIDGTSYLPVRAIGEAIGREVSFDADLGIELKVKEVAKPVESATKLITDGMTDEQLKGSIESYFDMNVPRFYTISSKARKMQDIDKREYWEQVSKELQTNFDKIKTDSKAKSGIDLKVDYYNARILDIEGTISEYEQAVEIADIEGKDTATFSNGLSNAKSELAKLQAELEELKKQQ